MTRGSSECDNQEGVTSPIKLSAGVVPFSYYNDVDTESFEGRSNDWDRVKSAGNASPPTDSVLHTPFPCSQLSVREPMTPERALDSKKG